jgi:hypothetical protein
MTPDSLQNDFDVLRAMRERAQALAIARDPLFCGAVAQLLGIIDGLIRVTIPPADEAPTAPPPSAADNP